MSQPCDWELDVTCCSDWDKRTPEQQEIGFQLATMVLWAATGRRFGRCEITVQPCREIDRLPTYITYPVPDLGYGLGDTFGHGFGGPVIEDGKWFNRCGPGCSCKASCEIPLAGPTTTAGILQITVGGETVPPSAYQIQDGYLLVRVDGKCWPTCVDYSKQDPPQFTVTYLRGTEPPAALKAAGGILACEFAKACAQDEGCRLPTRLSSISQPGVSVDVGSISEYLDLGLTQIPEVDAVIVALNPYRQQERSRVYSPDRPQPRMVT